MAFSDLIGGTLPRGALRLTATALLGLSVAACVGSDDSYFDDGLAAQQQEDQPIFHRLLTGTVFDPPRAQIEYTARSPLVVPPSQTELPAPQTASASAKASVAWPTDPDETEAAARAARARPDPGEVSKESTRPGERLTPEEVQAARIPGGGMNSENYSTVNSKNPNRFAERLTPEELAQKPALPSSNRAEIGAAPVRKYLIEPPSQYRTPATTAAMPEVKEDKSGVADGYYDPRKSKTESLQSGG